MDQGNNIPFGRGETFYRGNTIDANNLAGAGILGQQHIFPDTDQANTPPTLRSASRVVAEAVRNVSGVALLPKRLVVYKAGKEHKEVDGYTRVTNVYPAGVVDDHLSSAGCPANDIFWLLKKGRFLITSSAANGNMAIGDWLVAATAAASTISTTAGRMEAITLTGATEALGLPILGAFGRALTAKTTGQTSADVLVDCNIL